MYVKVYNMFSLIQINLLLRRHLTIPLGNVSSILTNTNENDKYELFLSRTLGQQQMLVNSYRMHVQSKGYF